MSRTIFFKALVALSVCAVAAYGAWFVDDNGVGFVGKGDVQLAFDWNNHALQTCVSDGGCPEFRVSKAVDTTWTCKRDAGTQTQERTREITTQGLLSSVARVRNQVTGFNLTGFSGDPTTTTDGPAIGSCPAMWTEVPGSRATEEGAQKLEAWAPGFDWTELPGTL